MENLVEDFNLRKQSLGSFFVLSDSFILAFLKRYVSIPDLVTLSEVSRAFYLFAEHDDIWKRLCIRKFGGDFLFKGSWKRTALVPRHITLPPYKRLIIPSYYSIKLYKKWYRSNTSLEPWKHLPVQNIDRRSNLSVQEFREQYESKCKPVIITDIVPKWKAATAWTIENLLKKYSNEKFKTDEPDPRGGKLYMKLPDYLEYAKSNHDEDPIYLFDDKFNERPNCKDLLNDYAVPPYFQEDYFDCLAEERPPYRWVAIGPERSGTPFHIDPYRTSAWNGLISGRKRWCLYPYHKFPPGINMEWDDDGNFDHDSPYPLKWYLEVYPHLPPNERPIEFIMEPGELVFVPSGWWHQVINLEDTVAVTQNYCNDSNFETVCAEINFDDDDFYEEFQECVEKKFPNIKWPKNLPKTGFKK